MNYIETWRRKAGLTRKELAKKLEMAHSTIQMYETGKRYDGYEVKVPVIYRLACAALEAGLSPIGPRKKEKINEHFARYR